MTTKILIKNLILEALKKENLAKGAIFQVERVKTLGFGDYATNAAFILGEKIGLTPGEFAQKLKGKLVKINEKGQIFKKIEVAGGGFINFFLAKKYLIKELGEILEKEEHYGRSQIGKGIKTQVEFVSANPTGVLHLGTGRNAFFGDALANVLDWAGFDVQREYYVNDAKISTQIQELGKTALGKGTQYQNDYIKTKIKSFKDGLKDIKDESEAGYFLAQEIMGDVKKLMKRLSIKFDAWIHEEDLYQNDAVKNLLFWLGEKGLTYEKEGALWLKTADFGDEKDRVLIRKTGQPTYFLSDILYHQDKIRRGFKKIINIWGADHQGHVKRMQAMMRILGFDGALEIPIIQMVRLKTKEGPQKMSKRLGTAVDLSWLIDEAGSDAARFFMLSKSINAQMLFDLELARERSEKNPVYYVQYALVRCKSILRISNFQFPIFKPTRVNQGLLNKKPELELIGELIKLPEMLEEVAKNYEIHQLIFYGLDLAKKFHQFYKKIPVLRAEKNLCDARIALILATKIVLENLLTILGISRPEKM